MGSEMLRIWKEALVACFKVRPVYLSGGTQENHHGKPQGSLSAVRNLNSRPSEHELVHAMSLFYPYFINNT